MKVLRDKSDKQNDTPWQLRIAVQGRSTCNFRDQLNFCSTTKFQMVVLVLVYDIPPPYLWKKGWGDTWALAVLH